MKPEEIADVIIAQAGEVKAETEALKKAVEDMLKKHLEKIKNLEGTIPDEETFLKVVAALIDKAVPLPQPWETFDGVIFGVLLKIVDKHCLDKLLGADWFTKMKKKIGG